MRKFIGRNRIGLTVSLILLTGVAYGDNLGQPVVTLPSSGFTGDGSGTITVTNVFQSIFPASISSVPRKGCLIVNTSTDEQWVFFGPQAQATKATSIPLNPAASAGQLGGYVNCSTGTGIALQDQVSITGTIGDAFVAKQQ